MRTSTSLRSVSMLMLCCWQALRRYSSSLGKCLLKVLLGLMTVKREVSQLIFPTFACRSQMAFDTRKL